MESETIKVIRDRKQFYLREGEIELNNAMKLLHSRYFGWDSECEKTYRELLDRSASYLTKAEAMEELLKIFDARSI